MTAIVVLGMHRSGTSCLAGMIASAGLASAGDAIRNWDNARGHHEMLDAVRLDEAVLAHSGGHWLSPPRDVRWTEEHAAARDRLLTAVVGGCAPLLKDPRMLLALPFWRASRVRFHAIGIVRHPLAVARSLASWRGMPLGEAVALWLAHNVALAEDHARHGYPLIDFEQPGPAFVRAVEAACSSLGLVADEALLAEAYDQDLVHHDPADVPDVEGLGAAIELYEKLSGGHAPGPTKAPFPRAAIAAFERTFTAGDHAAALGHARDALAAVADVSAVLVPVVTFLVRHRAFAGAARLVDEAALRLGHGHGHGLVQLLHGKIALAAGDATRAVHELEAACAAVPPMFQALHLLPQALRQAGRNVQARAALERVARDALYPHGPLATLAEWSWLDGRRAEALEEMRRAIEAAPPHRRGRLRTRLAEWLIAAGAPDDARAQLERALVEDPAYTRIREVLATIP